MIMVMLMMMKTNNCDDDDDDHHDFIIYRVKMMIMTTVSMFMKRMTFQDEYDEMLIDILQDEEESDALQRLLAIKGDRQGRKSL